MVSVLRKDVRLSKHTHMQTCIRGLESCQYTFLWRLIQNILPTQDRLYRILPNVTSPSCLLCNTQDICNLPNAMFYCKTVGQWLLHFSSFAVFYTGHLISKAFFLTSLLMKINNFQSSGSLPIYTMIWTSTMNKKSTNIFTTRATLKPSVMLLRKTRCSSAAKQNKIY